MAKKKYIDSPDKLWELFKEYEDEAKRTPFIQKDWVGKDGMEVYREKERPLTTEGFEDWLFEKGIINDLGDYFSNKDDRYTQYATICRAIKRKVRKDQIEGGLAGIYTPSITQRINGLVEKQEQKSDVTIKSVEVTVRKTGLPQINCEKDIA